MELGPTGRHFVTLRDVAEASGVSISTVSRVLDDRTPPSRSETAQRVRQVAEALGYRRNIFASNLRRGATATIGVLVPRLTDAVMALMFEALERAARRQGYFAVVATCGDDPAEESRATETLLDRNVDGLILATARLDDALPASLRQRSIPHVLVLRTDRVSPSSLGDDEAGGYLATRHLIDLGHRDIAIVTGPWFTSSGQDRQHGAQRALLEAGIELPPNRVISTGYGVDDGIEAGRQILGSDERPTAIFAANDNLAIGVVSAARALGVIPGEHLSVVGYNDIPLASRLPTPLTSVHTPFDQIASAAFDLLLGETEPGTVRTTLPTLIPRASTAPPR
ncbi:LacI family DNA-binding transcriptional regulator [Arthrobacter sp. NtRootA1]|uniref:LacI family DNA-binding transcriptional regulator n=1 Tax=Arthrobacter sp. NtRootA1 TaxID=2830983 RepID=UPI001CC5ADD5|nr:LacI family DNA-binding transcriptional regulator [Arthrobacter sp. NtRootA1]BCW05680.1 LacI family transcriptional regulator [Arthrobacter sp. NtRootA1]